MKKALVFLITVLGILSLAAQSNMFLQLSEEQITPEIYEQIERNNAQVRGPSFNFVSTPYNLPDNADIADPLTGRFNEDTPWTKDFSRHVVNPEGNQLYFYFSNTEHFIITQPDSGNPLKLRFQPIPTHWYGSELMVITVSDEPLDRTNRATATAIIRINVSSVPDPPLFVNLPAGNIFTIDEDASLSVNFRDYINCIDSSIENFDLYVMQTQAPIGPETYNVMVSQAPNIYTGHQVTFTPQPDYNNPIGVRFIVTAVDRGSSAFSTVEIIVRIIPENDPPQIVSYLPANLEFTIDQNTTQAFSAVTQDADNDVLAHEWLLEGLLNGIPFSNVVSTNADLSYLFDVPGTYTLTYTVSDTWTQDSIQWTIHVRPIGPLFNPVGGVFDHAITVTLTAPAGFEAAIIYYTLDGSLPVPGAPGTFVYDQPIPLETLGNIENIKTIRALYVHPDFPPSQVVSYNYRITGQVAELVFNPVGGTYYSQVAVNITCPNAGATIWYTTDGSDPIPGDPDTFEYTGPIVIPTGNSMVIKAMATRADWIDSPTRTEAYNVTGVVTIVSHTMTPPPLPDGEFYTVELGESMPVEILGLTLLPPSATLYYTLDSSIPGPTNPAALIYTPGLEIPLTCPTWITFRAYNPDWLPSTIYTYFYDVRTRTKIVPFVNGTVFDPVPGTYTAPVMVSLSLETVPANAPVYYTTDGTDPIDDPALLYNGPIDVSSATTIKVIARDPSICPSEIYTGHYVITGQLEMPQFSPPPSSYQVPEPITIYHDRPGVTIYYTLNGDDPDEFANLYSAPINLPSGTHTIKARAYLADWIPSNIRTGVYRFGYLPVPVFNLEGGIYTAPIVVELSSTVAGASILYTTTVGGVPSTLYNTGIPVGNLQPETVTIRAKATRAGWADSDVVEREFTVTGTVAMPSFNPPGSDGPFNGTVNVTIATATPGAQIKYTLDGQDPSESYGIVYAGPVAIAQSATLKARAFLADWAPSAIRTDVYTILGDIAMPVFTPAAGTYTGPVNVFISVNPPDAQIYYTADGTIPTAATGIPYVAGTPIPVSGTSLLQAIAVKPGWNDSPIATALYTITGTVAAPVIAPVSGTYYSTQTITITSATPGATIVYTTDGTEPSRLNGLPYARPFNLGAGVWAVKAMAWLDTWADSPVTVNNYVIIINPPIANPVFSPPGGYYNDPVDVTITAAPADATIYYTLDGTIPSLSNWTAYSGPISVNAYTQIKAIAIRANWPNSGVSTADYYFRVANPVLSVPSGAYDSPQSVSMSVTTPGALIRYTTDGSDPSGVDGTLYDGTPVLISNTTQATTVKAIAYLGGWVNSSIVTYTYVINPPVADPFFSVQGGDYYAAFSVAMTTLPSIASIYYTTDGSDPSEVNGTLYMGPVAITENTTLKARAYMVNYPPSGIRTAVYNLFARPVSFDPPGGTYNANQNVTLSTVTPGATIWYTTDGSDPIPGVSSVFDPLNPVLVDHNLTIKAIAGLNNWFSSPITSASYIIDIPLPNIAVVQILPRSGVYTAPVDV
ncbi:MAG TPA: chitobiase/beta-hexosaminidase C-terminal domain-containing protein, partial [Candidatus Cloacimonadota bacterium]|nr:chitobiase/beta-hexosaminidase C-terminal domain-containing protein [Candidatus Cloacimonadota bacterium]